MIISGASCIDNFLLRLGLSMMVVACSSSIMLIDSARTAGLLFAPAPAASSSWTLPPLHLITELWFFFWFSFCKLFAHILKSQSYKLWFPWPPTSSEHDQLLMRWCSKFQIWSTRTLLWKQRRWSWRTLLLNLILVTSTQQQQQQQLWHMRWTSQSHQLCIFLHTHFPLI